MKLFMRVSVMILLLTGMLFTSTAAPVRALSGGPDGFDYSFVDSVDPGPNPEIPVYNLEDISASGNPITGLGDAGISAPLDLGFSFRYYGASYDKVYVCINGFITFVSPGVDCPYPDAQTLPNAGIPNGVVAGWWGDLDLTHSGAIYSATLGTVPNRYFVVEFLAVPHFDYAWSLASAPLNPVTLEFKLFEGTNNIEVHYQAAPTSTLNDPLGNNALTEHSDGVENASGTIGLQYYFDDTDLATPLAVRYYYNDSTPPTLDVTSQPADPDANPVGVFNFTVADTGGSGLESVTCQLDGAGFSPCTSPFTTPSLSDASHTFEINALDGASNLRAFSYTWLVDTVLPDTNFSATPSDPSSSASADFSFTGSDAGSGVARLECQLDGGGFSTCSSPLHYAALLDGLHTFDVRAVDGAGNIDPSPASFGWRVDTVEPGTHITDGPADPSGSATASFTFEGLDAGGSGVDHFECQTDGGGFASCDSPKDLTGLSNGSHTFEVRAVDEAGNADSTPATSTWTVDTLAPDTSITANPTNPSANASPNFSFTGSDAGGSGVASFECKLDSSGFSACISPNNLPGLAEGSHTFEVRAIDAVGHADPSPASFTWVVDTLAPDTSITGSPTDPSPSASPSFTFSGSDGSGSGVARLECKLDSASFATCTSPHGLTGLADGSHTFLVRAVDAAGNPDPSPASYTWTVDATPPDTNITGSPTNPSANASPSFNFTGSDGSGSGVAGFQCQIDGGGFAACPSPHGLTGLADGSHTFQVRAVDSAGNPDPTPASYTWVVDTLAPTVTIDNKPANPTNSTTGAFTFTGNGTGSAVATLSCKLDGGNFEDCTPGSAGYLDLLDGPHTFSVYAVDAAGNSGAASPTSYTWTVDTVPPPVPLLVSPTDTTLTLQTSLTLTWQASGGASGYLLILDGGAPVDLGNVTSTVTPVLAIGEHTWSVAAYDAAGNTSAYATNFTFTVGWPMFLPTVRK